MANLVNIAHVSPGFVVAGISFFTGTGAPTGITATQGSIYINLAGTTTNDRMYINTNGATTWTNVTTAA